MEISVGVSNRHIHLKQSDLDILFGHELTKKNDLKQPGNFAANETLTIKTDKGIIENVRVLGPVRPYTQIEISKTDAYKLGLNPPVRKSGDLMDSEIVTLIGPHGSLLTNGCIIADRHIHVADSEKERLNLPDMVKVRVKGDKSAIIDVHIKSSEEAYFEMHLDTDDANALLIKNGDSVEILDYKNN